MNAPAACSVSISSEGKSTKQTLILQRAASIRDKHRGELRSLVENLLALKNRQRQQIIVIVAKAACMPSIHDTNRSRRQNMHCKDAILDTDLPALASAACAGYQ